MTTATAEARRIEAWVDEDPEGRAAEGLARIAALDSDDPAVTDIAETLAMTASAVAWLRAHPAPAPGGADELEASLAAPFAGLVAAFREQDHPRDGKGRFARKPDRDAALLDLARQDHPADALPPLPQPSVRASGPLTPGESMSRDGYMSRDGNDVYQHGLRDGTVNDYDLEPGGAVNDLDHAIAKYALIRRSVAYRGIADTGLGLKPGAVIHDKGYTSVSADKKTALWFAQMRVGGEQYQGVQWVKPLGGKPVVVALILPEGAQAMPGDISVHEFVLPRDGAYEVTGELPDGTLVAEWKPPPWPPPDWRPTWKPPPGPAAAAPAAETGPGRAERMAGAAHEITVTWPGTRAAYREEDHPRGKDGKWARKPGGRAARKTGAELDALLDFDALAARKREWGDREDHVAAAIWQANGYATAPTRLVSRAEFDRLTRDGSSHIALYRGIHGEDQAQADRYAQAWKHGTQFAGEGIHGSGTYTSADQAVGEDYAWAGAGVLLRIGLAKDARIISQRDIENKWAADKAAAAAAGHPWSDAKAAMLEDPGHYASYLGYDAVAIPRAEGHLPWYTIQNREATVTAE